MLFLRLEIRKMSSIVNTGSSTAVGSVGPIIGRSVMSSSSSSSYSCAKGRVDSASGVRVAYPSPTCENKYKEDLACIFSNIRKDKTTKYQEEKHVFAFLGTYMEHGMACFLFREDAVFFPFQTRGATCSSFPSSASIARARAPSRNPDPGKREHMGVLHEDGRDMNDLHEALISVVGKAI